ncbi:MAG: hypothetical protein J6P83_01140 [Bacteroidales bacterium]|nr:hypothetical protein [Bacteroidales bacterium]
MNDKFESQKETLISIKQEISLLYQQVNYLLRNEKPLELLDLDVLMNRTHTLYDQLCSINVGDESLDEDLPFDADDLAGLFGGMTQDAPAENTDEAPVVEEQPVVEEPQPEPQPAPVAEAPVVMEFATPTEKAEKVAPEPEPESQPMADDFGIFLHFENIPEEEKTPETKRDEQGRLVHVMEAVPEELIPERDRVHGEDLVKDNPLVMPRLDDERKAEKAEIEQQASGGMSGFFEQDDTGFELSTGETLGEKMMGEDNSLAAKLQQNPVRDLKSVIGINDKFLFVNELFGGSMEKYNKSIENLNDLKTLNGAMIYLNELKIELQWNSSNEAYLKLKDLITRKFE